MPMPIKWTPEIKAALLESWDAWLAPGLACDHDFDFAIGYGGRFTPSAVATERIKLLGQRRARRSGFAPSPMSEARWCLDGSATVGGAP